MRDADRTKEELINELVELRQRMAELEASEAERKRAEEALADSEEKYRGLVENLGEVIYAVDQNGVATYISPIAESVLGYSPSEIIGRSFIDFIHPEDIPISSENFRQLLSGQTTAGREYRIVGKSGEIHWMRASSRPIVENNLVVGALGVLADITERKRAEQALLESEKRYRELADFLPQTIYEIDERDNITFLNRHGFQSFGYTLEDLNTGLNTLRMFTPEDRDRAIGDGRRVLGGEEVAGNEYTLVRKDGTTFPILVYATPITRGNRIVGLRGLVVDITERKQAEEREKHLQQELYLTSQLASIGELTAGVAHEINNPLTGILGFSERLLRKSTNEEISRDLARIHDEAQRMAQVVANLLTFARRGGKKKEYLDINEVLGRTQELRAYELRTSNIKLDIEFTPSLPTILADAGQIQQVFLNIILNAEQAMTEVKHEGKLTIKTELVKDCVRISFADDGPGIPAENLDKLFDPFFTTRGEKGGIGLGLSICHGILAEHGGKIYVESKTGKGATFFVELPTISGTADRVQKE